MSFASIYLSNQQKEYIFEINATEKVDICIVIPCFYEKNITFTLDSLWNCFRPGVEVHVILVVNSSIASNKDIILQNQKTIEEAENWKTTHIDDLISLSIINAKNIPEKDAGVGFARKTGMDSAVFLFNKYNKKNGIIVCLDADCTVKENYLTTIENAFKNNITAECATIYFEHKFDDFNKFSEGIAKYELHLRYMTASLRYIGFPNSYFTVGSCFAVKAERYVKQGGMNKRKAGEDFYFLQKVFSAAKTIEINDTVVFPSSRISSRVPFGTGAAMKKFIEKEEDILTYNPEAYEVLKIFLKIIPELYHSNDKQILQQNLPEDLQDYLNSINIHEKISETKSNTSNLNSFIKRFYFWFNAFMVIKYLNYSASFYKKVNVISASKMLAEKISKTRIEAGDVYNLLKSYREYQNKENYVSPL